MKNLLNSIFQEKNKELLFLILKYYIIVLYIVQIIQLISTYLISTSSTATTTKIMGQYISAAYFINYNNGFISRGFLGTFFNLFPDKFFILAIFCYNIIIITFIFVYFYKEVSQFINKFKDIDIQKNKKLFMGTLSPILLISFFEIFGRFDNTLYLIFILILLINQHFKNNFIKFNLIIALSIMGILIHQIFIFLIFPFILITFIDENKYKEALMYSIICMICFIFCYIFGKQDFNIVYDNIIEKISKVNYYKYFKNEHFCSLETAQNDIDAMLQLEYKYSVFKHPFLLKYDIIGHILCWVIYFIAFIIPLSSQITMIKKVLIKEKTIFNLNKYKTYCFIIIVFYLPLYILAIDYERWIIGFSAMMNITFFYFIKNKNTKEIVN